MPQVWIALGSNIDPEANLKAAASLLRERWPHIEFSSVYRSAPREVEDQADFLNAAATFETEFSVEEVFNELQIIEKQLGKAPPYRFGPRTIDLDLLLYGDLVLEKETPETLVGHSPPRRTTAEEATIVVPHPRMHERRFVLEPLSELIDPEAAHPILHKTWQELLVATKNQAMEPIDLAL